MYEEMREGVKEINIYSKYNLVQVITDYQKINNSLTQLSVKFRDMF